MVDGSVFVSAGSANPTSTIAALALRAADHLIGRNDVPRPQHRHVAPAANRPAPPPPSAVSTQVAPLLALLTSQERAVLRSVADILIPAVDAMPAASAVGVADKLVDQVLRARPDLVAPLRTALSCCEPPADASYVRDHKDLVVLRYVVAGAYYLASEVRLALDYRPEIVNPVRALGFPDYLEEGLLDHLL